MTGIHLNSKDRALLEEKGISVETLARQLEMFRKGTPYPHLVRAATPGDGIQRLPEDRQRYYKDYFNQNKRDLELLKFVPASGAATRMFKTLLKLYHEDCRLQDSYVDRKAEEGDGDCLFFQQFVNGLKSGKFAFIADLSAALAKNGLDFHQLMSDQNYRVLLEYLLTPKGLNYANLPKALLQFHNYDDSPRTSLEEQIREAEVYATSNDGVARLHFTVSSEFLSKVEHFSEIVCERLAVQGGGFEIGFSVQNRSTDTIAVGIDNLPLTDVGGRLIFRPGGHGALIKNLDALDADIIFIKNIDNVVPDHLKSETLGYQEVLGGYMIETKQAVHGWLARIEEQGLSPDIVDEIQGFLKKHFALDLPEGFAGWDVDRRTAWLVAFLNRPIRVCGMVENLGEPGGGPFWVAGENGTASLQIVEKSQVNVKASAQLEILETSTHFNPVILVCSTKNFNGEKFDLDDYVDPETYFISEKSINGKPLKALELPGLWNGAMARWLTVFVEIPASTFTPVKTVNDLLRPEHQPL